MKYLLNTRVISELTKHNQSLVWSVVDTVLKHIMQVKNLDRISHPILI